MLGLVLRQRGGPGRQSGSTVLLRSARVGDADGGDSICQAAEGELLLWLQNYLFRANSELLKYRGEGYFHPVILRDISVADFPTNTNNKKNYS